MLEINYFSLIYYKNIIIYKYSIFFKKKEKKCE